MRSDEAAHIKDIVEDVKAFKITGGYEVDIFRSSNAMDFVTYIKTVSPKTRDSGSAYHESRTGFFIFALLFRKLFFLDTEMVNVSPEAIVCVRGLNKKPSLLSALGVDHNVVRICARFFGTQLKIATLVPIISVA